MKIQMLGGCNGKEFSLNKERKEMLDFLQDLKEERIRGIKTGFYVPIVEQGHAFYQTIHHGDYAFELNGKCYRQTREGNEHDLKEVKKRKNIEKLFESIENNDLKSVKECLAQGIDVKTFKDNIRDGYTPLMQSSYHGHLDIAKYLIEQGADVNAKDSNGKTALDYIVISQQIQLNTGQDFGKIKDFIVSKGGKLGSQVKTNTINKSKTKQKSKSNDFEGGMQ